MFNISNMGMHNRGAYTRTQLPTAGLTPLQDTSWVMDSCGLRTQAQLQLCGWTCPMLMDAYMCMLQSYSFSLTFPLGLF